MEKMIILNIEHKEPMLNHFRWFWIKSAYDFTQIILAIFPTRKHF